MCNVDFVVELKLQDHVNCEEEVDNNGSHLYHFIDNKRIQTAIHSLV